jgi:DNA-binding NtrC family response regulator
MSRQHAKIRPGADGHEIEDLNSRNGTFLNGKRVTKATRLKSQDVVSLGDTLLVVDQELPPDATTEIDGSAATRVVGGSFIAQHLRSSVVSLAQAKSHVMLLGPTGAGKDVIAHEIHRLSARGNKACVDVNCANLNSSIAATMLFGSKKGAYTDAVDRLGYFQNADGGVLFLDEFGDLPPEVQVSLLRVLEDGMVPMVGGRPEKVDVRVIGATLRDLDAASFRYDLTSRFPETLHVPPLKEHRADILTLWEHFEGIVVTDRSRLPMAFDFAEALLLPTGPTTCAACRRR